MIRFLLCVLALMTVSGCGLFDFRSCDGDSTFIYTRIWEHYSDSSHKEVVVDTMEYMSGSFRIRPVDGEKWNSFD